MKDLSMTQAGNYVGALVWLTEIVGLNITDSEIETSVKAIIGLVAVGVAFYGRYRKGDLFVSGKRIPSGEVV